MNYFKPLSAHLIVSVTAFIMGCIVCSCSSEGVSDTQSVRPNSYTIHGYVTCNGQAVEQAVVSDGVEVAKSDKQGHYILDSKVATADFVRISIPSGYEVECAGILPQFYHAINHTATTVQRFDFALKKVDNQNHMLIVMADVHISGRTPGYPNDNGAAMAEVDSVQFRDTFVPKVNAYAAKVPAGYRVYGLNIGDMTHSEYWYSNNTSFREYLGAARKISFPVFHVIGNHDYNHKVLDDGADRDYKKSLGPTYYSFNLGQIHYIVLDDMDYHGNNTYQTIVALQQMDWIRKDLAAMSESITQVVVAMHVPSTNALNPDGTYGKRLVNFDAFYGLFTNYKLTVLSADLHSAHTVLISGKATEYIHPAVCGTWWYRPLCSDGTPASFTAYRVTGEVVGREIVPFAPDYEGEKYHIYNRNVTSKTGTTPASKQDPDDTTPAILINLWHWNAHWKFQCYEDGVPTTGCGMVVKAYDPQHKALCQNVIPYNSYPWCATSYTEHMFGYIPKNKQAQILINITDAQGSPLYVIRTSIAN